MRLFILFVVPVVILASFACERKTVIVEVPAPTPAADPVARTKTIETSRLGAAIDAYEREPDSAHHADVKKALADLDGEIAEHELRVAQRSGSERDEASVKVGNLQSYRTLEVARFTAAQAKAPPSASAPRESRTGAEKVEDTAQRVGNTVEDAARKTGAAIRDAVR